MKKFLFLVLTLFCGISGTSAFSDSARSSILIDMDSNAVIYEKNAHEVRSVASISKIMTAILAIESGKINDTVLIGEEINDSYGSGIYIKVDEEMQLLDLVYGLMLRSGNDAALSIANYVGGDVESFVNLMNTKAKEIGMKNTKFNNPNGLDEKGGNLSTAYDMAILTSYAMKNEIYREVVSTKKHTVKTNMNYYSWTNKHKLLNSYKYATGGKTGFTEIARRTLVTTASKDNLNLVVVTLNDGNDFSDHVNLFEEAFNNYTKYRVLKSGNINIAGESYYLKDKLYVKDNFDILLPDNSDKDLSLHYKLEKKADYNDNDVVGSVELLLDGKQVLKQDVYVIKKKEKKTFWQWIKGWFGD